MKSQYKKRHLVFIDIETVANFQHYSDLSSDMQELWDMKSRFIRLSANGHTETSANLYQLRAGIYSEFSKVICVSLGQYFENRKQKHWSVKSFYGDSESDLLNDLVDFISVNCHKTQDVKLIGHNIKEFDIPFLIRRMLVNGIQLPNVFQIRGKKPWEIDHLVDTMNLWKFGDFKNYTSLNLLAKILNVPSSKESLDGSKIHDAYWVQRNLEGIKEYCEMDVLTTSQVYFKLIQEPFPKSLILTNNLP